MIPLTNCFFIWSEQTVWCHVEYCRGALTHITLYITKVGEHTRNGVSNTAAIYSLTYLSNGCRHGHYGILCRCASRRPCAAAVTIETILRSDLCTLTDTRPSSTARNNTPVITQPGPGVSSRNEPVNVPEKGRFSFLNITEILYAS